MAILDDIFGPGAFRLTPDGQLIDWSNPDAVREVLNAAAPTILAPPAGTLTTADVVARMQQPAAAPMPTENIAPGPRPGVPYTPPVEAPAATPARTATPAPVDPMERLGAILQGLGDRNQGALARIGGGLSAGPAFDRAKAMENQTVAALVSRGLDQPTAEAVARNPQLLVQYLAPNQGTTFGVVGVDRFGNQVHGWIDPRTRSVTPVTLPGSVSAAAEAGGASGQSLTGAEFLATLPQDIAAQVKAITEGRAPYPTGQALRTPQGRALMAAINQYDPSFNAQTYAARQSAQRDFASGRASNNIRSLNTVFGHLDTLNNAIDGLGNFERLPLLNQPLNAIRGQFSPEFQANLARFNTARDAVAAELMRVFREIGASTTEIQEWRKALDAADSPASLKASVNQAVELVMSRLGAVNDTWNRTMGDNRDTLSWLAPHAREVFDKLTGSATAAGGTNIAGGNAGASSASGGPPAAPPPAPAGSDTAPPRLPAGLPSGSMWSPSRRQWRDPSGRLYDAQGKRLGT